MDATLTKSTFIKWFRSEVARWRAGAAAAWSLIFVFPLTVTFLVISSSSISSPISSVIVATLDFWIINIVLVSAVLLCVWLNSSHYTVSTFAPKTRLAKIIGCIHPKCFIFVIGHLVACGIASWCAVRLVGGRFKVLSYTCSHDSRKQCLNEVHLFIVLYGCINGAILAVTFFTTGKYVLRFPAVAQRKLFEVKAQFSELLVSASSHSFSYIKYYYLVYFFTGNLIRSSIMSNFDLDWDRDLVSVATLRGMMDLPLLLYTWFTVTFAIVVVSLPHLLYCAFIIQPYVFPIEPQLQDANCPCLHQAIDCREYPLLQYLACRDLTSLSKYSAPRRSQLFSLNTLGAQPISWNNVKMACLAELDMFIQSLGTYCGMCSSNGTSALGSTVKPSMQSAAASVPASRLDENVGTKWISPNGTEAAAEEKRVKLLSKVFAAISRRPEVAYFIAETPEMVGRSLLADAQKYIFIVEGLSRVVCASFTEDVYGVVQPSLPVIVTTLLDMLEAVDRHLKLCQMLSRRPRVFGWAATGDQTDTALRFALKASIKCAIYRLVVTFEHHLDSIELSPEHKKRLQLFENFKE